MDRISKSIEIKHNGNNCCQAVLLAYADELGLPEETLRRLGAGFGLGMGNMQGDCGALCGAEMVLGLMRYQGKPILKEAAALQEEFQRMCGAKVCREIKGIDTGVVLCSCDDCVTNAVRILEGMKNWTNTQ